MVITGMSALSMKDLQNLALNIKILGRYLEQHKEERHLLRNY